MKKTLLAALGATLPILTTCLAASADWTIESQADSVKTQIWIAVSLYLMVAILPKSLKLPGSLLNTLQILSVDPFGKNAFKRIAYENCFSKPRRAKFLSSGAV